MPALRLAQRGTERRPRLGEFPVELRRRAPDRHARLLQRRLVRAAGGLVRLAHRRVKLRGILRERAHAVVQRAQRIERLHAPHLKSRSRNRHLQRTRLRLAALQIRRDQFHRQQIARLHARLEEIPLVPDAQLLARLLREHGFIPAAGIDLHEPRHFREAEVVRRGSADVHHLVCGKNEIGLRLLDLHRRQKIRLRADFIFGRKLVFKSRLRAREMHAVAAARVHRDFSREQPVRTRGEHHGAARLALLDEQIRTLHGLVCLQLQLDLRAFERGKRAVLFRHTAVGHLAVFWKVERLCEFGHIGPFARIEQILPRERIAGLDAIPHARTAHLHGCRETIISQRLHVHHLPATGVAHRLDARAVRGLAREQNLHTHRVALRHDPVAALGQLHDHLRARDALQIGPRREHAQQQRPKAPAACKHHRDRCDTDGKRPSDRASDQRDRQQRLHLHAAHATRDIRLQQRTELLRIKDLARRAPEFHRREQILTQPWLRVLDQPRKLPLVGRVQQLPQTLPPQHHEHREIRRAAQRPPRPLGQPPAQIHARNHEHREHERRDRGEHSLDGDEPPAPPRKCVQLL